VANNHQDVLFPPITTGDPRLSFFLLDVVLVSILVPSLVHVRGQLKSPKKKGQEL
jgi:hypothetical protein